MNADKWAYNIWYANIKYYEGFKYQLCRDARFLTSITNQGASTEYISLHDNGRLYIKEGYAWDGPSGPTIDSKASMRASLLHDALYELIRKEKLPRELRKQADEELRRQCIADGMWKWRANLWYHFVRRYAAHAAHPDHRRKEYTAP